MVRGGTPRRSRRGKKAVVAVLALMGVAFLGGCTSTQAKVAITSCSGENGIWQVAGTLTNTDSSSHSYTVAGELLTTGGAEVSSSKTTISSVAGGATTAWQVNGTADPNIEAEGGLTCRAGLNIPASEAALALLFLGLLLVWVVVVYVSLWFVVKKAGRPGWHGIVPGYNVYVLCKLSDVSMAWFALMFVPWVNLVAFVMLGLGLARSFGKGDGFGVGLGLLPPGFYPVLAFGPATYQGPGGRSGAPPSGWSGSAPAYPPPPAYQPAPAYAQLPPYPTGPAGNTPYPTRPAGYPPAPGGRTPAPTGSRRTGGLGPPGSFSYRPGAGGRG